MVQNKSPQNNNNQCREKNTNYNKFSIEQIYNYISLGKKIITNQNVITDKQK